MSTSPPNSSSPIYFRNLDLVRVLAAVMVMIVHGWEGYKGWIGNPGFTTDDAGQLTFLGHTLNRIIQDFVFGVDVFFLISGFLITYLLLAEKEKAGKIHIKNFYLRRVLRIWPLYYLLIIISPILIKLSHTDFPNYLPYIFMYGNFDVIQTGIWSYPFSHLWSVCIEEQFYLIWPLIIAFVPTKKLPSVFLGVIALSIGFRIYEMKTDWNFLQIFLNTLSRVDILAVGALMAWFHFHRPFKVRIPLLYKWLLTIFLFYLMFDDFIYSMDNVVEVLIKKYVYVGIVMLLVGDLLFGEHTFYFFRQKTFLNYLGKISYGIYIYHNILPGLILGSMLKLGWTSSLLYLLVYTGLTLGLSILSFEFYEKWFLKKKSTLQIIRTGA